MKTGIIILALLFSSLSAAAIDNIIAQRFRDELTTAKTRQDSIRILYNLFDISPLRDRRKVAEEIYDVARRDHDYDTQLDVIRQMTNTPAVNDYRYKDSLLSALLPLIEDIPDSNDKRETEVFINLTKIKAVSRYATEEQRLERIHGLVDSLRNNLDGDIYDQIEMLGSVCILLGNSTHGVVYRDYMKKSWNLINSIPSKSNALRNLFLTQQAIINHNLGRHEDAVEADKEIIKITEELVEKYHREGRIYRNLDTVLYTCYRRLIGNFDVLTPEEIDYYYNKIIYLTQTNPTVKNDFETTRLPEAYYHMAKGEYAEAIPLLKQSLEKLPDRYYQRRILSRLIRSAREVNDSTTLLHALDGYNKILDNYIETEANDNYRELEIIYMVNDLKDTTRKSELALHRTIITITIAIIAFLLLLTIVLIVFARRYRRQSKSLKSANESLKTESENLHKAQTELMAAIEKARIAERHKTEFINNMSHEVKVPLDAITEYSQLIVDCADPGKKKYLKRYADIVILNTELLNTLVNDVLDIGLLESNQLSVKMMPASLQEMCHMAAGAVKLMLNPGVKLEFAKENAPDQFIVTDRKRVEQVLINLLSNSAKFTEEGTITLDYEIDRDKNTIEFSITDTGIGIPEGKEKVIFERFEKIDKHSQGSGLGLSICALIARLLKGEIYAEANRSSGARFIFTIPLS